jgi:hypothetical protein
MPKDHRAWGFDRNIELKWACLEDKYHGYPQARYPGSYDERVRRIHMNKRMTCIYQNLSMLSEGSSEWKYYGREWDDAITECTGSPDVVYMGAPLRGICPAAPGVQDFYAFKRHEWLTKNDLDGVYSDFASPRVCYSKVHGCNGKMPILAWREQYMRTYIILKSLNKPTNFVHHVSWGLCSPVMSFADVYFDGEQHGSLNIVDYLDRIPLDLWRTEFTGRQYGVIPSLIPATLSDKSPQVIEAMMGLLLLHDVQSCWQNGYLTDGGYVGKITKDIDRFGIGEADVEFIPYWNNKSVVKTDTPDVKTSIYRRNNGSALVVLFNVSKKDVSAAVNLTIPGVTAGTMTHLLTGEKLGPYTGSIKVPIKARNCRLIVIK